VVDIDTNIPECFVEYNHRVQQMIKWFNGNESIKANYDKIKDWASELNTDDGFGMDLTNFMLYCGGVRTWQLNDPSLSLTPPVNKTIKKRVRELIEISIGHLPTKEHMLQKIKEELNNHSDVRIDKNNPIYLKKWQQIFKHGEQDEILFVDKKKTDV